MTPIPTKLQFADKVSHALRDWSKTRNRDFLNDNELSEIYNDSREIIAEMTNDDDE